MCLLIDLRLSMSSSQNIFSMYASFVILKCHVSLYSRFLFVAWRFWSVCFCLSSYIGFVWLAFLGTDVVNLKWLRRVLVLWCIWSLYCFHPPSGRKNLNYRVGITWSLRIYVEEYRELQCLFNYMCEYFHVRNTNCNNLNGGLAGHLYRQECSGKENLASVLYHLCGVPLYFLCFCVPGNP